MRAEYPLIECGLIWKGARGVGAVGRKIVLTPVVGETCTTGGYEYSVDTWESEFQAARYC